ncbi:thioredoxin-like protein [Xylariales sp. AK1849]|nr:thioredoxin-like protein [Xylariales sp. AK1849]
MAQADAITDITSASDFDKLLADNTYVVTDFHASWCGPCKAIAPIYKQHATKHSAPGKVAFAKIDVDQVPEVAAKYRITNIPTFLFIKDGEAYDDIRQANPVKLQAAVEDLAAEIAKIGDGGDDITKAIEDENW